MIRLFLLIRSLELGGAERQLIEVAKGLDKTRFAVTLATFYDVGELRPEAEGIEGVSVLSLQKAGRWDTVPFLWRLHRAARRERPQIIQGWMTVSNELSLIVGRMIGAKSVWTLRASSIGRTRYQQSEAWLLRIGAWLSRFADVIIVNSQAGKRYYTAHGYRGERMVVIHNGIDTERFRPDEAAGRRQRGAWGIRDGERLVGLVGRLDPLKDHATFLRAAALLAPERPDVRFVCVGGGPAAYQRELQAIAEQLGVAERVIWAGVSHDMAAVYNALDIVVSSSIAEGFSNVIGEAMACGTPCVVTDVGDSATIVGRSDQVVPPNDPHLLKAAVARVMHLPREQRAALSAAARERIVREYNVQRMVSSVEAALGGVLG